jgi:integrase
MSFRHFLLVTLLSLSSTAFAVDTEYLERLVAEEKINVAAVTAEGEAVMPVLARIYRETKDEARRAKIAKLFYQLGWQSEEARLALMQDIHTPNRSLRLQVQWALGRVSNDDEVVDVLLDNMRNDKNPLFRDKAACALAYDQIHLTPQQRYRQYQGLVQSLNDPKPDVRRIAMQALRILTNQTRGFRFNDPVEKRLEAIARWDAWLAEYQKSL